MSLDANRALVRRYFEGDGDGRDNTEVWAEVCSPEMTVVATVLPAPVTGLDAVIGFTRAMHAAFDGLSLSCGAIVAEGDQVAAEWTMRGTHTGMLPLPTGQLPPTGRPIAVTGTSVCTVVDGRLVEERVQGDWLGMLQQLGVLPGG